MYAIIVVLLAVSLGLILVGVTLHTIQGLVIRTSARFAPDADANRYAEQAAIEQYQDDLRGSHEAAVSNTVGGDSQ